MSLPASLFVIGFIGVFGLQGCATTSGGDFCKTYENLVKNRLKLSEKEARALRTLNKRDLVALKKFHKQSCN